MPDAAVPSRADGSTRKRKRDAGLSLHTPQGDSNGAESSDTGSIKAEEGLDDVGPTVKPRRSAKAKKDDGPDGRRRPKKGLQPVECVVEWPERFKVLDKTHRALNLVFTFCCTRKHLATTFDTIKAAVESHTKRELLVADVAAVAALRPEGINFSFVDEVMLQMDVRGAERGRDVQDGESRPHRRAGAGAGRVRWGLHGAGRTGRRGARHRRRRRCYVRRDGSALL